MKTHIIIDSACDISKEEALQMDLHLLPLKILFGNKEYLDQVNLTPHEFYEKLIEEDQLPTTSQISPFDYEQIFEQVRLAGDNAVVITLSSKLSGTYMSANIAAENYKDCVYIVDSENVSIGEQLLVREAVRLRSQGVVAKEIYTYLNEKKKDICLLALLDTLEYLKKGGRISKTAAFAGGLLSIKPVIAIQDGEVVVLGKARGSRNGNNMLMELISKHGGIDFSMPYSLGYTGIEDSLLQKYIHDCHTLWDSNVTIEQLPITTIGSAIGTHAGPGGIAIAFFH